MLRGLLLYTACISKRGLYIYERVCILFIYIYIKGKGIDGGRGETIEIVSLILVCPNIFDPPPLVSPSLLL
jgi:hypothetical protein